jgi:hypothetical protein
VKHRIKRVDPLQVAKVLGALYAIMGLIFVPIFMFISSTLPSESGEAVGLPFGTGFALLMPILYGGLGFIFTMIGAALYNFVAGLVGGIEVELDGVGSTMA